MAVTTESASLAQPKLIRRMTLIRITKFYRPLLTSDRTYHTPEALLTLCILELEAFYRQQGRQYRTN